MTTIKLPRHIVADPAVAKAVEIYDRALKARNDAEDTYKRLVSIGVPQCAAEFDEDAAAARIRRAKRYDEVHGTQTTAAETAAVESERAACRKAHAKSSSEAKAAADRIEEARLEYEAADAVMHDTRGRLWTLVTEKAHELLPQLQAEYVKAAEALRAQAVEIRATERAAQDPLRAYEDPRPFDFGVPLPWRTAQADKIAADLGGVVLASGLLTFK